MITLRPYQNEALAAVHGAMQRGIRRPLVALPTGTGKTCLFAKVIEERPGRSLVIAHRDELLRQAGDKINSVTPGATAKIGYVKAEENDHDTPITIASVQTLSRQNRLEKVAPDYQTVIIDECHHSAAESYLRVIEYFNGFKDDGPLVLGVTATPERGDKIGLDCVFQEIVYQRTMLDMIKEDFLCDLTAIEIKLKVDFNALHTRHGDYIDSEVEAFMKHADAPQHIVEAFKEHAGDRPTIVFTPTVAMAHDIAERFVEAGFAAEGLDGTTPTQERRNILARLKSGQTQIVCNCGVLTEGFDEPSVACIITARPTKSKVLYIQMIGRGTRKYPGKKDCLIMDVVGVPHSHDLQTVTNLFGLPPGALKQKALTDYLAEKEQEELNLAALREQQRIEQGKLIAERVDLFGRLPQTPEKIAHIKKSRVHWLPKQDGRFILSTGQGLLVVSETRAGWKVEMSAKDYQEVLIDHLTQEFAIGFAEDHAKELGAGNLIDPNAKWRSGKASDKQLEKLRAWRIPFDASTITKGEASDLMTLAIADFGRRR